MNYYISVSCCIEVSFLHFNYTVNIATMIWEDHTNKTHIQERKYDTQNCDSRKKNTMRVF
jgi:hypothetical protein